MTWVLASVGDIEIINTEQIKTIINIAIKQSEAINRVRDLHKDNGWGECSACWEGADPTEPVELPCPTLKALDGEQ